MFMQFETTKGEKVIICVNKILLIQNEKKGVTVVLDDGTPITVLQGFDDVAHRLVRRDLLQILPPQQQ